MTALPLRRERGCAAKPTEMRARRDSVIFWASAAGSRRSHFCERDEAPIFSTVHALYTAQDVNQFVNHRDVETGGWPLDQRLSHWKVCIFLRSLAGVVGFEPTVHCTKNSCLTTWLHPNGAAVITQITVEAQAPASEKISFFASRGQPEQAGKNLRGRGVFCLDPARPLS